MHSRKDSIPSLKAVSAISQASNSPRSTPRAQKKEPQLSAEEQEKRNRKHQKKEELTREHDKIISEIEQNASMDTALKTVYTLGHVGRFQKKLEKRIRNQEREIERMCGFHYSHFVEAIEELSGIQGDASRLVRQVAETNKDLQELGSDITSRHKERIRIHKEQDNINKVIMTMEATLPILISYGKLREQMAGGKYYSALKTLQVIEHGHLPEVKQFKFASVIENSFPKLRQEVLSTSSHELKDFLEIVQVNAPKVGTVILQKYLQKRRPNQPVQSKPLPPASTIAPSVVPPPKKMMKVYSSKHSLTESAKDEKIASKHITSNPFDDDDLPEESNNPFSDDSEAHNPFDLEDDLPEVDRSSFVSSRRQSNIRSPFSEEDGTDDEFSEMMSLAESTAPRWEWDLDRDVYDFVDFTPIHKSLHIHSLLGGKGEFVVSYRAEREHQARLLFTLPKDFRHFAQLYRRFLHQILGFFAIEDVLLHSTKELLVDREWLTRLLTTAVSRVLMLLRAQLAYSVDCKELMDSKELTVAFSDALASYGFHVGVADLNAVIPEMWRQYVEGLLKHFGQEFSAAISRDNLVPMVVASMNEERRFFRSGKRLLAKMGERFPKKLPFSSCVLRIHEILINFIDEAHIYCIDVELSDVCVDVALAKSVESLLQRNLRVALEKKIMDESLTLEEMLQFVTNLSHMEKSVKDIETYIKELDHGDRKTSGKKKARRRMRELGAQLFQDLRRLAENGINPRLNDKLDVLLDKPFDWSIKEATGTTSSYLRLTFQFLEETFEQLRQLKMSDQLISEAIFATYQHIGFSLLEKLIDERITMINMGALHQLSLDVLFCLGQIANAAQFMTGNMRETLEGILGETWQMVDLFIEWDWETYFTEYGQEDAKYALVHPGTALKVMEKLRQDKKGKNMLASLNINKRKKQKMQDTVIKQLRGLMKDWSLLTVPHRRLSQDQQDFFRVS